MLLKKVAWLVSMDFLKFQRKKSLAHLVYPTLDPVALRVVVVRSGVAWTSFPLEVQMPIIDNSKTHFDLTGRTGGNDWEVERTSCKLTTDMGGGVYHVTLVTRATYDCLTAQAVPKSFASLLLGHIYV